MVFASFFFVFDGLAVCGLRLVAFKGKRGNGDRNDLGLNVSRFFRAKGLAVRRSK